jgi:hypothetical protein
MTTASPHGTPASHTMGIGGTYIDFGNADIIDNIEWSQAGVYAPSQITINAWTQAGGAAAAYSGYITIEETVSAGPTAAGAVWTTYYPTAASTPSSTGTPTAESSHAYTPNAGVTGIRIRVYMEAAHTTKLDEQIILPTPDTASLAATCVGAATGRFIIAETTDAIPTAGGSWTNRYTSSADESTHSYTPTATSVTGVRIRQYQPGGTSTLVREQVVPIVIATLSNDYHIIPSTSSTAGFIYTGACTDMRVYVSGVDDTDNWTFSVTGSMTGGLSSGGGFGLTTGGLSTTGVFDKGAGFNRYWVTNMSATNDAAHNTGTVTLRATKGAVTIDRIFTVTKQTAAGAGTNQTSRWLTVSSSAKPDPFRIYFAPANPNDALIQSNPSTFAVSTSSFINTSVPSPWFNGITVYIHSVDAEVKTLTSGVLDRLDSGVRLWNGRGSLISLDGTTYPGCTGLAFATNDAVYIVGHFNADGTTNSNQSSVGTGGFGGYSGRYPESATEMLTAVMGDAITILSQPEFARTGSSPNYTYAQSSGWSDSMSSHRRTDTSSGYSTSWATTNPGSGNTQEGIDASIVPAQLPNLSDTVANPGSSAARDTKFQPAETEISTCLLTGIVPTKNSQTSGGVHNFPRLLEDWSTGGPYTLYIRGSMVAMFQSQVATEPWSIRYYQGAVRSWGLHQSLRDVHHHIPLEPIVLGASRMHYREITAAQFNTVKTQINALPH